jgi:hypothetical protein
VYTTTCEISNNFYEAATARAGVWLPCLARHRIYAEGEGPEEPLAPPLGKGRYAKKG